MAAEPPPPVFDLEEAYDWVVAHVPDLGRRHAHPRRRAPHPRLPAGVLPAQGRHRATARRPTRRVTSWSAAAETVDYILDRAADDRRGVPARAGARGDRDPAGVPPGDRRGRAAGRRRPGAGSARGVLNHFDSGRESATTFATGERRWSSTCTINLGPRRCAAARAVEHSTGPPGGIQTAAPPSLLPELVPPDAKARRVRTSRRSGGASAPPDRRSRAACMGRVMVEADELRALAFLGDKRILVVHDLDLYGTDPT